MIVCHCTGATDRDIRREALLSGGALSSGPCAAAGQCCGGCADKVRDIAAQALSAGGREELQPTRRR
jgi:bacterioferritin-associated ferredoxin